MKLYLICPRNSFYFYEWNSYRGFPKDLFGYWERRTYTWEWKVMDFEILVEDWTMST